MHGKWNTMKYIVPFIVSPNTKDLPAGAGFPPNKSPILRAGQKENSRPARTAILVILDTVDICKWTRRYASNGWRRQILQSVQISFSNLLIRM